MKLKKLVNGKRISIRNRPNRENGTTFSEFPFVPGISSGTNQKIVYHLHPNQYFREFVVNGKQPLCSALLSCVPLCSCVTLCYPVLLCFTLCSPVLHCVPLYYSVLPCITLCYLVLPCVTLCYSWCYAVSVCVTL